MSVLHRSRSTPPATAPETADTAMTLASSHGNRTHAQHLVALVISAQTRRATGTAPEDGWETDGGHVAGESHRR
jgi:hypothetical protein